MPSDEVTRSAQPRCVGRSETIARSPRILRCDFRRLRRDCNGECEPRAVAQFTNNRQLATVRVYEMLDDCETQPGALGLARARLVEAIKPLEHSREIPCGNTDACVLNTNRRTAGFLFR